MATAAAATETVTEVAAMAMVVAATATAVGAVLVLLNVRCCRPLLVLPLRCAAPHTLRDKQQQLQQLPLPTQTTQQWQSPQRRLPLPPMLLRMLLPLAHPWWVLPKAQALTALHMAEGQVVLAAVLGATALVVQAGLWAAMVYLAAIWSPVTATETAATGAVGLWEVVRGLWEAAMPPQAAAQGLEGATLALILVRVSQRPTEGRLQQQQQ